MIAFDDLRKILLLENVSDAMLGKMVPLLEMHVFGERDIIFQQGDDAEMFYLLKEGKVLLEVDASDTISVSMGAMKAGFSFGWSSIFGEPYSFMAICAETSEILMINAEKILGLMQENHSMGFMVMQSLTRMMKNRMDRVEEQFLKAIKEHPDFESLLDE